MIAHFLHFAIRFSPKMWFHIELFWCFSIVKYSLKLSFAFSGGAPPSNSWTFKRIRYTMLVRFKLYWDKYQLITYIQLLLLLWNFDCVRNLYGLLSHLIKIVCYRLGILPIFVTILLWEEIINLLFAVYFLLTMSLYIDITTYLLLGKSPEVAIGEFVSLLCK